MYKSTYAISLILVRTLVATLSLLGLINCTKAALAQQSYTIDTVITSITLRNQFSGVNDITTDVSGNIYVLDSQNSKVHVSNSAGQFQSIIEISDMDRFAKALFVNSDSTISVISTRRVNGVYMSTVRKYTILGEVITEVDISQSDSAMFQFVRLSDGKYVACGTQFNKSVMWLFDPNFELVRSFEIHPLPGQSIGQVFAGRNGNVCYTAGFGYVVEVTQTGEFASSISYTISGIEYPQPSGLLPLSSGRWILFDIQGFIFEIGSRGEILRTLLTPKENGGRFIGSGLLNGSTLVYPQQVGNQFSIGVRDLSGSLLAEFGSLVIGDINGLPALSLVGFDDFTYVTPRMGFSTGSGLFKINNNGALVTSYDPNIWDGQTGSGTSVQFAYSNVSADVLGRVNTSIGGSPNVVVTRHGSDGIFESLFFISDPLNGLENRPVYCDEAGNRYFSSQYYTWKISSDNSLMWKQFTDGDALFAVLRDGRMVSFRTSPFGLLWVVRSPEGDVTATSPAPDLSNGGTRFVVDRNGDIYWKRYLLSTEVRKYDIYGNLLEIIPLDIPTNNRIENFGIKRDGSLVGTLYTESPGFWEHTGLAVLAPHWTETIPPTTAVTTNPAVPTSGWYTGPVTVQLSATDNAHGSRVKNLQVTLDSQSTVFIDPVAEAASLSVTGDGNHSLTYFATDYAGNVESTKSLDIRIDGTPPVSSASVNAGLVTLSSTDAVSAVYKTYYSIGDSANINEYTGPIAATMHKIYYWSVDNAGNVEVAKSVVLNPAIDAVTVSASRLTGGFGVVGTVTLSAPAPTNGTTVTLVSSNPNIVGVEPSILIPAGQTSGTFDIDAIPVVADTTVIITAAAYATSKSTLLTIHSPQPSSLGLSPQIVSGGTSTTATISISGPAPVGGTVVSLASSSLSALVPTSLTIPAGQMTATFTVSTNLVANDTSAVISAIVYGVKVKSTLSILGPKVTAVTLANASIASTVTTTGTVTLSTNAPVGGKVVALSSSNTRVASVPVSVTVPAGSNTANFTITAGTVAANTTVTITAATNGSTGTATLTVTPPAAALSTLTTNVTAATGGVAVTGTLTLTRAAPTGGAIVTLASSSTTIGTVPSSVTVPAGATSATFTIMTRTVTAESTLTITGTYLGVSKSVAVTVNPVRLVSTLTLNPTSVRGGVNSTGTVTLTGVATEAVIVTLTSGTTTVARVPATVTVPTGATTVSFAITTLTQTATRTSVITARTGTTSRTATLSVTR